MKKILLKDIVFVLPGILGSVLEKDGKPIWEGFNSVSRKSLSRNPDISFFDPLIIPDADDGFSEDLEDGITPTNILEKPFIIPGLIKSAGLIKNFKKGKEIYESLRSSQGYSDLRNALYNKLKGIEYGHIDVDKPANYFEFPYDWRRNNAYNARRLARCIKHKLEIWKTSKGIDDSKVILIGHSMGGLISKYYLEVLGGWKECRALFSIGTPFYGATQCLEYMIHGRKMLRLEFGDILRSLTSCYQLLPTYSIIEKENEILKLEDIWKDFPEIDSKRYSLALKFHKEIENAVATNLKDERYQSPRNSYIHFPIVGINQQTISTITSQNKKLTFENNLLNYHLDQGFSQNGDGTVPEISQIPLEARAQEHGIYVEEQHATLQLDDFVILQIVKKIHKFQMKEKPTLGEFKVPRNNFDMGFSLGVKDVYPRGEISINAVLVNDSGDNFDGEIDIQIQNIEQENNIEKTIKLNQIDNKNWEGKCELNEVGFYYVKQIARNTSGKIVSEINDIFYVQ